MQILVSSNEWPRVKDLVKDSGLPATLSFDFMLFTNSGSIAAERKRAPGDLLSSVSDGRLARECAAMREDAEICFLIVESRIHYSRDLKVIDGKIPTRWTKEGLRNLLRSIRFVEGVEVEFSENLPDTIALLKEIQDYFDTLKHGSYRARPAMPKNWFIETYEERFLWWLQGLPGISRARASKIASKFPNPEAVFSASVEDWLSIGGFGSKTVMTIFKFLHGFKSVEIENDKKPSYQ